MSIEALANIIFTKYFGGGPVLRAAAGNVTGLFRGSGSGGGYSYKPSARAVERSSLLGSAKATPLSAAQVANRFSSPSPSPSAKGVFYA